jgi:WD40 repeat protein
MAQDSPSPSGHPEPSLVLQDQTRWQDQTWLSFDRSETNAIAVDPQGQFIFTGTNHGELHQWDVQKKQVIYTFPAGKEELQAIVVTPNGQQVIAAGFDGQIKGWQLYPKQIVLGFNGHTSHRSHGAIIHCLALSDDGKWLFSGDNDGTVKQWSVRGSKWEQMFTGHQGAVTALAWLRDNQTLISTSNDHTVRLWDRTGKAMVLEAHATSISALGLNEDQTHLITVSADGMMVIWDLSTRTIQHHWQTGHRAITSLAMHPTAPLVAIANHQSTQLWHWQRGELIHKLNGPAPVIFTDHGQTLISGNYPKPSGVKVWRQGLTINHRQRFNPAQSWWEILGVTPNATRQEIKVAFRGLAQQFHPDRNDDAQAREIMQLINLAYDRATAHTSKS